MICELSVDLYLSKFKTSTPVLDRQGLGRLSRGKYFYKESMNTAKEISSEIDWDFCMVKGVGHESRKMGGAAAKLLYGGNKCIENAF